MKYMPQYQIKYVEKNMDWGFKADYIGVVIDITDKLKEIPTVTSVKVYEWDEKEEDYKFITRVK